jgi:hypothetical protein
MATSAKDLVEGVEADEGDQRDRPNQQGAGVAELGS